MDSSADHRGGTAPSGSVLRSGAEAWWGAAVVAATTLTYLGLWWNRYLGPTLDGYFSYYGHLLLSGKMPYRDFYLHVPPLIPLQSAALEALFGPQLLWPRVAGVVERVVIALLCYAWLARLFRVRHAVLATLLVIFVGSGDTVDVLFLYNHHALLWGLAAGLLAALGLARRDGFPWLELASGACAGLAFLTKQTVGLGLTAAVPAALLLAHLRRHPALEIARRLGAYAAGWLLPVSAVAAWLASRGALAPAIDQLFMEGPTSKGALPAVLARALTSPWQLGYLRLPAVLAVAALAGAVWLHRRQRRGQAEPREPDKLGSLPVLAVALGAIAAAVLLAERLHLGSGVLQLPHRFAVLLTLYGCCVLSLYWGTAALRRPLDARECELLLLALVSLAIGYMFSLSWPTFEPIVIPGLGLLVCLATSLPIAGRLYRLAHAGTWAAAAIVLGLCTLFKLQLPFDFAGWAEPPVAEATERSALPELEGFLLAPGTVELLEETTRLIQRHSEPGEAIFVYPHLPLLYLLSHRETPTFASVHWFDVCSDAVAEADTELLRRRPPAVVVDFGLTEEDYRIHEDYFRQGSTSGQRRMQAFLEELKASYLQVGVFIAPGSGHEITVWAQPQRPAGGAPPPVGALSAGG